MEFKHTNELIDERIKGMSISATITVGEYMGWFNTYGLENKLEDQRPVMKTRSANMIRKRLIEDLKQGAVIPPIVLGFTVPDALKKSEESDLATLLNEHIPNATVIDGMQRTEALKEALSDNPNIASNEIRVDIWITSNAISLIYRMLVLNTGQTPWDVKRQIEVIYKPLITECKEFIAGIVINTKNDSKRRTNGGEYLASSIVELFLAFSSRKEQVNNNDKLADDFTRLDVTQMTGIPENATIFYECIKMLYKFDLAISKFAGSPEDKYDGDKFFDGPNLFTQMPAKIGFIVALAQLIMGRIGIDKDKKEQMDILDEVKINIDNLCCRINAMETKELESFLSFGMLNERINSLSVKKIGDEQRRFFRSGFEALFNSKCEIQSMDVAWRAY